MSRLDNFFGEEYIKIGFETKSNERTIKEVDFMIREAEISKRDRILDLCCGIGRHTKEFAKRGYQIVGMDYNNKYLKINKDDASNGKLKNLRLVRGDMRQLCFFSKSFDVIISFFGSFGYYDEAQNQEIMKNVSEALRPKGRFLIDVKNRDYVLKNSRFCEVKRHKDLTVIKNSRFDCETSRLFLNWIYIQNHHVIEETTFDYRLYSCHELYNLLAEYGLATIKIFGNTAGDSFNYSLKRLIIVARKDGRKWSKFRITTKENLEAILKKEK